MTSNTNQCCGVYTSSASGGSCVCPASVLFSAGIDIWFCRERPRRTPCTYGSVLELGATVVATVEDGSGMGAYTVQADVMPAGSNKYALGGVTYRGGVESCSQACASRRLADDYSQMPSWLWHGRHKKLAR